MVKITDIDYDFICMKFKDRVIDNDRGHKSSYLWWDTERWHKEAFP